jgi:hypothetical protein
MKSAWYTRGYAAVLWLVLCCTWAAGGVMAQTQLVLDTGMAANGLLAGYSTSDGGRVVRSQLQEVLVHRRFEEDGTPGWHRRYQAPGVAWADGALVPTSTDGAILCGSPALAAWPGAPGQSLSLPFLAMDADGLPLWSTRLFLQVAESAPAQGNTVRMLRAANGDVITLLGHSDPGTAQLRVVRMGGEGQVQWAIGLGSQDALPAMPWGAPGTLACMDGNGGLLLVRIAPEAGALVMVRVDGNGVVDRTRAWLHEGPYDLELHDMAIGVGEEVLVLGRMAATGLPSGGMLMRFDVDGDPLSVDRYQWDVGTQLFPTPDGGFFSFDQPWLYRTGGDRQVQWARFHENWAAGEHLFVPDLTEVDIAHGRLRMHGALRRIHVQSNTQRVMPLFMQYAWDDLDGCQLGAETGFGYTAVGDGFLAEAPMEPPPVQDLGPTTVLVAQTVTVSDELVIEPGPLCNFVTGITALPGEEQVGFSLAGNPIPSGTAIQLRAVLPGMLRLLDAKGRLVWQGTVPTAMDRFELALPMGAAGLYLLRWDGPDGRSKGDRVVVQ